MLIKKSPTDELVGIAVDTLATVSGGKGHTGRSWRGRYVGGGIVVRDGIRYPLQYWKYQNP
jgi:hypothetical protein